MWEFFKKIMGYPSEPVSSAPYKIETPMTPHIEVVTDSQQKSLSVLKEEAKTKTSVKPTTAKTRKSKVSN